MRLDSIRPAVWGILAVLGTGAATPLSGPVRGDAPRAGRTAQGSTASRLWKDWDASKVVSFQLADDRLPRDISAPAINLPRKANDAEPTPNLSASVPPASGEPPLAAAQLSDEVSSEYSGGCDGCSSLANCCCKPTCGRWFQNTEFFIAGDGWKNIFDDDDNNNFGYRTGFNIGFDLPGRSALRGQLGASYGAYDFHGREGLLSRDDPIEQQLFVTTGIYKRSNVSQGNPLAWGAVYDLLMADEAGERADRLRLGQIRGYVGHALSEQNEVGVWMAMRVMNDYSEKQREKVNVTDQVNLFWHRYWQLGGDTTAYVGWADDPGNVVIGLNGRAPLSKRVALFGTAHYIVPSTTGGDVHPTLRTDDCFNQEAWNVSFGIVFYLGGNAVASDVSGACGLPLLPVADNGSFSYQADLLY